jgi:hypothetical protein
VLSHGIILSAEENDVSYALESPRIDPAAYTCELVPMPNGEPGTAALVRSIPKRTEKTTIINGQPLTDIISNKVTEYLVDLDKHGAILKMNCTSSGKPYFSFDIDYEKYGDQWQPSGWTLKEYRPSEDRLRTVYTLRVRDCEPNAAIPDAAFEPQVTVGDLLMDGPDVSPIVYTRQGTFPLEQLQRDGMPQQSYVITVLVALGVVVVITCGYALWRKRLSAT